MRLEKRTFDKGKTYEIIAITESEKESQMIDLLGNDFTDRTFIPIKGEIRLSDGFGEHYILLRATGK